MISFDFFTEALELLQNAIPTAVAALPGTIGNAVTDVGSDLPTPGILSEPTFGSIVTAAMTNLRPLVYIGGIFVITLSGFRMITTEEEETFNKTKRIISATIAGIMLAFLVEPFVDAFYGGRLSGITGINIFGGIGLVPQPGNAIIGARIISGEVLGVINWALTIVAVLAVFMIIISGLKAIASAGSEEGLTQLRRTVFSVVSGLLLIVFRFAINATLGLPAVAGRPGTPGPAPAIAAVINILNYILGFMGIVALAMLIFAGMQMILNLGSEEIYGKAKGLAVRVGIGFIVIMASWAVINIVIAAG